MVAIFMLVSWLQVSHPSPGDNFHAHILVTAMSQGGSPPEPGGDPGFGQPGRPPPPSITGGALQNGNLGVGEGGRGGSEVPALSTEAAITALGQHDHLFHRQVTTSSRTFQQYWTMTQLHMLA